MLGCTVKAVHPGTFLAAFAGATSVRTPPRVAGPQLGGRGDGRALEIERAGHWPHHDRPALVVDLVRRFLRGEEPTLPPESGPAP